MSASLFTRRVRRCAIVFEATTYYSPELAGMDNAEVTVCLADDGLLRVHNEFGRFLFLAGPVANHNYQVAS
ncbi:Mu transposase C-terminal domain-containing protein [Methylomonas sp. MS20]|uniref:Mu transposase C-terminal domain-containing protein n=1 Tax=unclassified Methylomonas TaxID=2608980 RepID=UPI0028A5260F|nr:Mu transposase C-terminal domain-containing protein [Methylomonas sp. MV1]MDT4328523.1 hypothetical protein [Methylomonas sp. MV1]